MNRLKVAIYRARIVAYALATLSLLAACSDPPDTPAAPPPSAPQARPPPEPPPTPPSRSALECAIRSLSPPLELAGRPRQLAIHELGEGAVAWLIGDTLTVGSFDDTALSPQTTARVIGPQHRLMLVARTEHATIAMTQAPCIHEGEARPCLHGHLFDEHPRAPSSPTTLPLSGPITSQRRARSQGGVYLAHAHQGQNIQISSFEPERGGALRGATRSLGTEVPPTLSPVEVLGMAAHENRWAVFWRFGAEESPTSEVVLSLPNSEHQAPLLRHALSLDTVLWRGGSIRVVAGFEFARPALFRIATNGRLRWLPRAIPHEGALPSPNQHHYNARLQAAGGGAMLEVSSAAGDPLTRVGPFGGQGTLPHRLVDVSRGPGGFVVATARSSSGRWGLGVDRVLCPGRSEPPTPP